MISVLLYGLLLWELINYQQVLDIHLFSQSQYQVLPVISSQKFKLMKPIGFVYLTTNIVNGKIYVGQFTFKKDKRLNANYLGSGTVFEQAIKKYGRKNFKRKILKLCYSINQLNGYETYYTLKYNPKLDLNIGYNQIIGPVRRSGNKNPASYPNIKNKMIEANRKTTSNPEYRKRQSEIMKEYYKTHEANFKGCKHSKETREKIRQKSLGRKAWNKGKHVSEEQKRKQSKKMKGRYVGENNPNYGNKWNEELRKHLSNIKKIQYIGRKWITNGECEKFVNINNELPQGYCLGRLKKFKKKIKKKMRNKDIQTAVINKYGVDKLLHIAYGGWITALFDNLIAMVFIAIVIGVGKELVDKYIRKSKFDYKDMIATWLGGAITIIIKLIINML